MTEPIKTQARAKSLSPPRMKPKVVLWVGGGMLLVGLSSFVSMFIIFATLNHWW